VDLLNQKRANTSDQNDPIEIPIATCTTSACTATEDKTYSALSTATVDYYEGTISSFTMQEYDTPVITSLYVDESRKTNNAFVYRTYFTDRIPI
jgi:hypothetical protein